MKKTITYLLLCLLLLTVLVLPVSAKSGQVLDYLELGGMVEASPAVYEDMLVVGSRDMAIWGIKVK